MRSPSSGPGSRSPRVVVALAVVAALGLGATGCSKTNDDVDLTSPTVIDGTTPEPAGDPTGPTDPPVTQGGSGPLAAVDVYEGLTQGHVDEAPAYRQTPPVGGDHFGAWANCGAYDAPVEAGYAVHAMEHGAVWITYAPDLPAEQVATLQDFVVDDPYVLVSPWTGDDLPTAVVLSAWGVQVHADSADEPAVAAFVDEYAAGSQTPEPGAPCTGGVGTPDKVSRVPA